MARLKIEFDGFEKMIKNLEAMEVAVEPVLEKALVASFDVITPKLASRIPAHRVTGATADSLITTPRVEWNGNEATIKVGFDLKKDITSQFLLYGAEANAEHKIPKRNPDIAMWNAVHGTDTAKQVEQTQQDVFFRELEKYTSKR